MRLDKLESLVDRLKWMVYGLSVVAVLACVVAAWTITKTQALLERVTRERPILVVPGAVPGEYIGGISEENIAHAGRYLMQLGQSFTPQSLRRRSEELLSFAAPSYSATLAAEYSRLAAEVEATSQSRALIFDRSQDVLKNLGDGRYELTTKARRLITAASLQIVTEDVVLLVVFRIGVSPDEKNRYGLQIEAMRVQNPQIPS